jgi:hypothetical protein
LSATEGQQGLLKVLSGAVVLTGGLVALTLLATNPKEPSAASIGAIARAPASLVTMALNTEQTVAPLLERTSTLVFDCQPPVSAIVTQDTKQIRLSGKLCATESAEVTNMTNGYTATIFKSTPDRFTSDYIHLAEGNNRLRITYLNGDGQHESKEFQLSREPASTQSK